MNPTELYTTSVNLIQQKEDSEIEVKNVIVEKNSSESLLVTGFIEDLTISEDANIERFAEKYRDVEVELTDSDFVNKVIEQFNVFESNITLPDSILESNICLRLTNDEHRISMQTKLTDTISSEKLSELRSIVFEEAMGIPSEKSLYSMVVNMSDTSKTDSTIAHHDFTIHFTTDKPHTYWLNCDTLEDYFEMVADNNEDMTFEDIKEKDTYYAHTHLMGENSVAEWIEDYTNSVLTNNIEVSNTNIISYPSRVSIKFPENSIELSVTLYQNLDS